MTLSTDQKRTCGSCNACCTHLEIESLPGYSTRLDTGEDLAKEAGTPCRHLTSKGCAIYQVRPLVCRNFVCDWALARKGYGTEDLPVEVSFIGVRGNRMSF